MRDFLSVDDLTNEDVQSLIESAVAFKKGERAYQSSASVVNMFFEDSTRTKHSFEMAEHKVGMHIMNFDVSTSSVKKGESMYDSVLTMQAIGAEIAVIRHQNNDFYKQLEHLNISIVNAGSGSGSHPSQSLLDMMTIYDEFGCFEGLKVAIIGDIKHSRVAMSNMRLLHRLGAKVSFAGPAKFFDESFLEYGPFISVDDAIRNSDVVMLLRIQLERHDKEISLTDFEYHTEYGLTLDRYETMQERAVIMHPAPVNRDVEIASELVECDKARIVEQMTNGMFMRMAILEKIVEGRKS
ncbi:aspartate carbamoyltransferase catalytic subunit [Erysipelothrix sp. HDW6C]|uniref:aspartate carbamoyltransferase catalytic subunit n=1 Tax=Erysipelothrix sp. HDW6C TaxID=2714930 RepID=UPI00140B3D07|nr:aspartate carbamoyltransferase catalytic subunit [Erysipelothrix sp. HDW6C]QIK69120.1 aspartate carbamoyltransferase catalytic subunit [Erysipelothrix sp. HDW6C]